MIEYILKWLNLVPLLDHNNENITYSILDKLFNKFRALIKVFTN
jgi:hemoglobin-like flavoprotein